MQARKRGMALLRMPVSVSGTFSATVMALLAFPSLFVASVMMLLVFFFSSRRLHTRFDCDWSSDVCSSDLSPVMNDPDPFMCFAAASPTAIEVPVLKVFDGDGFLTKIALYHLTDNPKDHTEVEAAIRFGFIDAPELEQRGGCEAREFLTALIGGRKVWIVILRKMDTGKSVDRYGRVVA